MRNLNKRDMEFLERVFAAEIDGRMYQSKSKLAKRLEEGGYIVEIERRFGPVVCRGYRLTVFGNATYCMSLKDEEIV